MDWTGIITKYVSVKNVGSPEYCQYSFVRYFPVGWKKKSSCVTYRGVSPWKFYHSIPYDQGLSKLTWPMYLRLLTISQKLLHRSQSNLQHLMLMYSGGHPVNFIEIRQGWGFVFCLHARLVYSAKYSVCHGAWFSSTVLQPMLPG